MAETLRNDEADILIVEDSRTQAEQLRAMLEQHRLPTRVARNGAEALALLKQRKPLLVISDINMPEMDGYELCRRIRADATLADLPLILLTGLSDPDDVILGLECGADNFVIKPPDESYLLSRIHYIMANRHLRPQESARISLEIQVAGRKHFINADRLQVLHLLLSTYESAVLRGKQLATAQEELRRANGQLEEKVRERTAALTAEVAERSRLNEELKRSGEKYRQLFDNNPMPMWVFDRETLRFLAVNDAAVRHYGYSRREFLAMTLVDVRPTEDAGALHQHLAQSPPDFDSGEWEHRKKSGELITVQITGHDILFEDRPARLILANDVTARKRAEEMRRASEQRFERLFHESSIAKVFGLADGRITEINPGFCELVGRAADELVGRTLVEVLEMYTDGRERADVREAMEAGREFRNRELRFRGKSGEIRSGLLSLDFLTIGATRMYLATVVEITDRKALEAQLLRFHRAESVGRLAGGIAHDMNNVLAPIIIGVPLLRMKLSPAESEKILSTIETSAERGAGLVRQLLTFGRGMEGERRPVDPRAVVADIVKLCRQTFPRNIDIEPRVADDVWSINGDETQIHQIVLNLAVNARDAMNEKGGRLCLAAENVEIDQQYATLNKDARAGRYVLLRVSDSGVGIPPEVVEHIFDPYFTTKPEGKGTGLGLSTVQEIVRSHGGFLRLQSEVGRGTTFEIHLPASREREAQSAKPAEDRADAGHGELIMVVDDEESVRSVLRQTLARRNYKVVTAENGVEAIGVIAHTPGVQLVITDVDMPLMDGVALAHVLRRMNPALPIIASTGLLGMGKAARRREELEALQITEVLNKPYPAEVLLRAVSAALRDKRPASAVEQR